MKVINKPWGYEKIWAQSNEGSGYLGKILCINSNSKLSLQFHTKKEETILVKSGTLRLETLGMAKEIDSIICFEFLEKKVILFKEGEILNIKPFYTHRFCAEDEPVELLEVSTNFPDDVVRVEDDYGRSTIKR